uniref:Putative secreted peptide n=1 Tax=Anopheles braziliensis TaxID=58242 RepID=A0A2M3ZW73_9DIPT
MENRGKWWQRWSGSLRFLSPSLSLSCACSLQRDAAGSHVGTIQLLQDQAPTGSSSSSPEATERSKFEMNI